VEKTQGTIRNLVAGFHGWAGFISFVVISLVIFGASIAYFVVGIGSPYIGLALYPANDTWTVEMVDPNGLAYHAGIHIGDKPVEINGEPADSFLEKYRVNGVVFSTVMREITVSDQNGQVKSVSLASASPSWRFRAEQISWPIVSIIFWGIGLYVILKRPDKMAARLLFVASLVFGLSLSANMAGDTPTLLAPVFGVAAAVVGPWILVHFFHILPDENEKIRRRGKEYLLYIIPAITLVLMPIVGWANGQPVAWFRTFRLFEYGLGLLMALGIMFYNFFGAKSAKTRQQMRIVLVSCLAALLPIVIFNLLPEAIWGKGQAIVSSGFSLVFIGLIPLGMGYAVVTQKLMDIDIVIRRTFVYGVITLVMAAFLSIAIFISILLRESISVPQEVALALLIGCLAAVLFGPLKNAAEATNDRLFYKDRYDYRKIVTALGNSLKSIKEFNEMSRVIVGTTVRTLNLSGGCLFALTDNDEYELSVAQGPLIDLEFQRKLIELIKKQKDLIAFPNAASAFEPEVSFMIPLTTGQRDVGVLCLSQKVTSQEFTSDDMYLLQGFASVATVALHRALLIRDVSLRDNFVSIASHELRTPLTAILGYAELLVRREPQSEERKRWASVIVESSQTIAAMLDDLLNVSRIQSGRVSVKLESVHLPDVVKERLAIVREDIQKHNLEVDFESGLPKVLADRDKLGQVITNLVSNAVKYSPAGGTVFISARNDPGQHRLVVSVKDEGMGISAADREQLFTTFHRINRPETQGIRGSGLGLYIVKEWVEIMGGDVWLESELNRGSIFFFTIPVSNGFTGTNNE